jgi:hypothetical protein
MNKTNRDLLVNFCAKVAVKAPKIESYIIVYQTKKGIIKTQRCGDWVIQSGLLNVVQGVIQKGFVTQEPE